MAHAQTQGQSLFLAGVLAVPFKAIWNIMIDIGNGISCTRELERLYALSDSDLAARGLTRDGVVQHVFHSAMRR